MIHYLPKPLRQSFDFDVCDIAFVLILIVGIFVRVWNLEANALFPSFAGIEWSRPTPFHQLLLSVGTHYFPLFVFLPAMSQILLMLFYYVFFKKNAHPLSSVLLVLMIAVTPEYVLYARMVYPTSLLLCGLTAFFISTFCIDKTKWWLISFSWLGWTLLTLESLWFFPLIVVLLYALWKKNIPLKLAITLTALGLLIGGLLTTMISPQSLLYQYTQFQGAFHLPRFWYVTQWSSKLAQLFTLHSAVQTIFCTTLILVSIRTAFVQRRLSYRAQLAISMIASLSVPLFFAAQPPKGFFVFLLLPVFVLITEVMTLHRLLTLQIQMVAVFVWAIYCCTIILLSNFFIRPSAVASDLSSTLAQQRKVIEWISRDAQGAHISLQSTQAQSQHLSISNYQVLLSLLYSNNADSTLEAQRIYYINTKDSELTTYPGAKITSFADVDVIQLPSPTTDFSDHPSSSQ